MTETSASSPITARGRVREELRKLILSGEFGPGTRLTQQQLARRFGVAQSVIRESLLELHASGLVESVDNLGVFVSGLDNTKLLQALEVREMLDALAARLCCELVSRADIRVLYELVERIYQSSITNGEDCRGGLDRELHNKLIELSRNQILARLTEGYRVVGMAVVSSRPQDVVRDEHLAIVRAIEANDPDEAERAARHHVIETRRALQQQMADPNFTPRWVLD